MYYRNGYAKAKATSSIIELIIKMIWVSLVYSPFVITAVIVFYYSNEYFKFHGFVCVIFSLLSVLLLFILIAVIEGVKECFRSNNNIFWIIFHLINIILISSLPLWIGIEIGLEIVKSPEVALFEQIISASTVGLILSICAYYGVLNIIKNQNNFLTKIAYRHNS